MVSVHDIRDKLLMCSEFSFPACAALLITELTQQGEDKSPETS